MPAAIWRSPLISRSYFRATPMTLASGILGITLSAGNRAAAAIEIPLFLVLTISNVEKALAHIGIELSVDAYAAQRAEI